MALFWGVSLKNIDGVYSLTKLDNLGIDGKRAPIDFCRLKHLKTLTTHWTKSDSGIENSKITCYKLWHYKPRAKTYDELAIPKAVKTLELNWCNPASLSGMPLMPSLETLHIHQCRNLVDLSSLPDFAPKLRFLYVTTSKNVSGDDGVLNHPAIEKAQVGEHFVVGSPPW